MNIIEANNISKGFEKNNKITTIINNVTLKIKKSSFVVILGPSGSGKTTLLNLLSGVNRISSGELIFNGEKIDDLSYSDLAKFRKKNISFVFQRPNLIPNLTVYENIFMGSFLANEKIDIDEIIKFTNLDSLKNKYPNKLSGGEMQKVAIARAISKNPKVIFLDEPTGSLDYKSTKNILTLLDKINKDYKTTIVLVTHNELIKNMADLVIVLKDGRIVSKTVNKIKKDVLSLGLD